MSVSIPTTRIQMVLMALAGDDSLITQGQNLFENSSSNYNQVRNLLDDKTTDNFKFKTIEKKHLNEIRAFTPTGIFDSQTSKELYFPNISGFYENSFKTWNEKKYNDKEKYEKLLDPDKDTKGLDPISFIDRQFDLLDPSGKPVTYFDDYSLCIFVDSNDSSYNTEELMYSYNINNFHNTTIRLNSIEITNQAKDQMTNKKDFRVKMEFNFKNMDSLKEPLFAFLDLSKKAFGEKIKTGEIDEKGVSPRPLILEDFIPNGNKKRNRIGIKIRTYFDVDYYPKLAEILDNTITIVKKSNNIFNTIDLTDNDLFTKPNYSIEQSLTKNNYQTVEKKYCYIDRIYKLSWANHNFNLFSNIDSNGSSMDLPHKLSIDFTAYTQSDNQTTVTIYSPLMESLNNSIKASQNAYELKRAKLIQKCQEYADELRARSSVQVNPLTDRAITQMILETTDDLAKELERVRNNTEQHIKNIKLNMNSSMIAYILEKLAFYEVDVEKNVFEVYEKSSTAQEVLSAMGEGLIEGASVGMIAGPKGAAIVGGADAAIRGAVTFFSTHPDIKDLKWVNLLNTLYDPSNPNNYEVTKVKEKYQLTAEIGIIKGSPLHAATKSTADYAKEVKESFDQLKKTFETTTDDTVGGTSSLRFFYLGDLIEVILAIYNDVSQKGRKNKFLTGNYIYKDHSTENAKLLNLGNLPISLNLFIEYLEKNLMSRNSYVYDCIEFINNIITDLVKGSMDRAWTANVVQNPKDSHELKKFIPHHTYLSKIRIFGKKEYLQKILLDSKRKFLNYHIDDSHDYGYLIDTSSPGSYTKISEPNTKSIQKISNIILGKSCTVSDTDSYDLIYISCKADYAYIDIFENYDSDLLTKGYGYNSLPFMEHVIENFQMPCILMYNSNVIPQILATNNLQLEKIDNASLVRSNIIEGSNLIDDFPYQGTIGVHSMYINFIDVMSSIFISPMNQFQQVTPYSGLYYVLKSTFKKTFTNELKFPEYRLEIRRVSNGTEAKRPAEAERQNADIGTTKDFIKECDEILKIYRPDFANSAQKTIQAIKQSAEERQLTDAEALAQVRLDEQIKQAEEFNNLRTAAAQRAEQRRSDTTSVRLGEPKW